MPSNPVADKLREQNEAKIKTLSTGIRVIIHPVSSFELQELAITIPEPTPPVWRDPETGRELENRDDPHFIAEKSARDMKRGLLSLDAMIIGVELVDGLPSDDTWLSVLEFKAKRGILDLSGFNLDNPIEREFVYKKYVAFVDTSDWELLQGKIKETQGAAQTADAVFQGDEERNANNGASPEAGSEGEGSRNNV